MRSVWLVLGCMALLLVLIVPYRDQLANAAALLGRGDWRWLTAAGVGLVLWQIAQTLQFQKAFELAGLRPALGGLLPVVLGNNCLNIIAPSASASSFALFAADARRRGWPAARALTGVIVFALLEYPLLGLTAGAGAGLLAARGALAWAHWAAAMVAAGLGAGALGLLAGAGFLGPRVIGWAQGAAPALHQAGRRWLRRGPFPLEPVTGALAALLIGWAEVGRSRWPQRGAALGAAGLAKAALLPVLYCAGRAFGAALPFDALVIGVSVSALVTVFSPTPQGLGVAEPALALALTRLGVPADRALVTALAYRALTLWLPVAGGFLCLQWWGRGWAAEAGR